MFNSLLFVRKYCILSYTSNNIASILRRKPFDERIKVKGWVKAIRRQKEFTFVDVNDGSSLQNLQVVLSSTKRPSNLGFHSSLSTSGVLRPSFHKGQDVELLADEIEVEGDPDFETYPFKARTKYSPEYVRQYPHLRARTNFSAMLRVRSQTKLAIQEYFSESGFINIDTPILTSNDCEGAGEVFTVEALTRRKREDSASDSQFFSQPVYLTVSGQLHLEAMASGLSKVYNFSPTFRAENSQTRRHLSEFWMVEAEEAFLSGADGFQSLKERIESLIKSTIRSVLEKQEDDLSYYWKQNEDTEKFVQNTLYQSFAHLQYHEAMEILMGNSHVFKMKPVQGGDLGKEHELFLANYMGNIPVFVTDWPLEIKAFYMGAKEEDPSLVYGLDLLFPGVGEVVGGGLREYRLPVLQQRLEKRNLLKSLNWYADLRKFSGRSPSGGFGLGFERLLLFLLGISNIKDTIPFPRWSKHCTC